MKALGYSFNKNSLFLWRDRWLAAACLLIAAGLVSVAFQTEGHEAICLILQVSASLVLMAAVGLSVFYLSKPSLHMDKIGISENGFLLSALNWSMTWNEIAYAERKSRARSHIVLIGLDSDMPEHVLEGYDQSEMIVRQIKDGLATYGRCVIEDSVSPSAYFP